MRLQGTVESIVTAGGANTTESLGAESASAVADLPRMTPQPVQRYQFGYAKYEPLMTTVEGVLLAGACVGAIVYSVRDLIHPDPVEDPRLIVIYSAASFLLSVLFGRWMKRVGKRIGSPLARAEAELWVVDGWLALGVCAAFVASIALGRIGTTQASAYVDPAVCIVLSLIFLKKPYEILRDSVGDLVDANPYADTVNAVEESARALAERFHLEGLEWVRVRKAGRRVFVMVSFFEDPSESLEDMDIARQAVTEEMVSLHPDVDVAVLFRSAPAKSQSAEPPRPLSLGVRWLTERCSCRVRAWWILPPSGACRSR